MLYIVRIFVPDFHIAFGRGRIDVIVSQAASNGPEAKGVRAKLNV
jgi:hypothetical protein